MPLKDLPADLAEPLHMLGPDPSGSGGPALAALAAAGLAWLFFRRRRAAGRAAPHSRPPRTPDRPLPFENDLEAKIEELRSVFSTTGNYRRGCHALAEALRRAIAPRRDVAFEALTTKEITRVVGDGAVARTLVLLEGLQFRPEDPSAEEFTACRV